MNAMEKELLTTLDEYFLQQRWTGLIYLMKPQLFRTVDSKNLIAFPILAKVAEILTSEESVPNSVKIACLKCLGNSCFNGYKFSMFDSEEVPRKRFSTGLYAVLSRNMEDLARISETYPYKTHFPYEGVLRWTVHFLNSYYLYKMFDEQLEMIRLSIQFLCNLFTFGYEDIPNPRYCDAPRFMRQKSLKRVIIQLIESNHVPIMRASCAYVHNAFKKFNGVCFKGPEELTLFVKLLNPLKKGFESAKEALMLFLCHKDILSSVYSDLVLEDRLYLLEIIYNELKESAYGTKEKYVFNKETIEFLIYTFCEKSELILKMVDFDVEHIEPRETVILLDILGVLTCEQSTDYSSLKGYKNLLINCNYLLKSIHMLGKSSNNCFTPLQKLSDVAPAGQELKDKEITDISNHPAYGFKAGLVRVIGNMAYKNKECQDDFRDMDVIPLLLDCCNIDAKNPLIMQWAILALRNLCENNPENQEIIRNSTRVGVVESSLLKEMGLTLHEDEEGKKIGIVPLHPEEN